ncbi:Isoflavone reductase-like protein [Dichanthelium oligosanthes]|uniref:Isoflavone reductase-like protein n=1 Tax=Dichanthelium oligosanthes TaxID=888268 RepID=A0A1E5V3Z0_9POAL|nr:Isoflavone reductase-like protein [Dichanthelium oligosanthes]
MQRFFPTEFGNNVDRVHPVEPAKSLMFGAKARIRRAVEAEGIPYTYVAANFSTGRFLPTLAQVFTTEDDIGTYTIKAVDDPRTLNKILYMRPPSNILSYNELVSLWEKKVGKTFQRVYIPEDEVLKKIKGQNKKSLNIGLSISHSVWVKGDQTNFEIKTSFGVEATELYPDVKYITMDEYLNKLL